MRKLSLLALLLVTAFAGKAQIYLSGASPYTQNFNNIASPGVWPYAGWSVYNAAGPSSMGTLKALDTSSRYGVFDTANTLCTGSVRAADFKNYASGNVIHMHDSCGAQNVCTDRAMGVRQTGGTGWDSGASFVFQLANTNGMSSLGVNFKLQSLDVTSNRVVTWKVQYGMGLNPTSFTTLAVTGTMTTGGNTFTNNAISGSFGTALDNQSSPVTIRIVTLDHSSGSGNRPSTAIDDFNLTWTGTAKMAVTDVASAPALDLTVLGDATANNITFGYNAEAAGAYSLNICDLAGKVVYTQTVDVNSGVEKINVDGLSLAPGMYVAKMSNGKINSVAKVVVQ